MFSSQPSYQVVVENTPEIHLGNYDPVVMGDLAERSLMHVSRLPVCDQVTITVYFNLLRQSSPAAPE